MLEFGDPLLAIAGGRAEFVEGPGMSVADDASIAELGGWFIDESGLQGFDNVGELLDVFDELTVKAGSFGNGREVGAEVGDVFERGLK